MAENANKMRFLRALVLRKRYEGVFINKYKKEEENLSEISVNKQAKREVVEQIKAKIENCSSFVIIDYKGLTVEQDTKFRKSFREAGVDYKVLKNTMVRIALNELGYKEFDESLNGPTAVAFGSQDSLAPMKVACEGIKEYKAMEVKCGYMDKAFIDAATVNALSNVPSKPILLSMLLSVMTAPVRGLAVAINAIAEKNA